MNMVEIIEIIIGKQCIGYNNCYFYRMGENDSFYLYKIVRNGKDIVRPSSFYIARSSLVEGRDRSSSSINLIKERSFKRV